MVANLEIRELLLRSGIKIWQLAAMMGYSEVHMSRLLRTELSPKLKEKAVRMLRELIEREEEVSNDPGI